MLLDSLLASIAERARELEFDPPVTLLGIIRQLETLAHEALLIQRALLHWRFMYVMDPMLSSVAAPLQHRHRVLIHDVDMSRVLAGICDIICEDCTMVSADPIGVVDFQRGCLRHSVLSEHFQDRILFGYEVWPAIMRCACYPPDLGHPCTLHFACYGALAQH